MGKFPSILNCKKCFAGPLLERALGMKKPRGYSLPFYMGGPCQQFISEPQILSHSSEEPQILSLRILRYFLMFLDILDYHCRKMSLNVATLAIILSS